MCEHLKLEDPANPAILGHSGKHCLAAPQAFPAQGCSAPDLLLLSRGRAESISAGVMSWSSGLTCPTWSRHGGHRWLQDSRSSSCARISHVLLPLILSLQGLWEGRRLAIGLLPAKSLLSAQFPEQDVCLLSAINSAPLLYPMSKLAPESTCQFWVTGAQTLI